MPEFWQFPTVSMGLGPLIGDPIRRDSALPASPRIRGHRAAKGLVFSLATARWTSRSLGAVSLAGREKLDNLIFVINCNLQRLDGPVRGNGKIVQELEADFRGAGWNVIKCLWGSGWGPAPGETRRLASCAS